MRFFALKKHILTSVFFSPTSVFFADTIYVITNRKGLIMTTITTNTDIETKETFTEAEQDASVAFGRSRNWILTIPEHFFTREELLEKLKKYQWVGQLEKGGKTGYLHYQIVILNNNAISHETILNKFGPCYRAKVQGSRLQAYEYGTKEDTRVEALEGNIDPVSLIDAQGSRTDLDDIRDAIFQGASPEQVLLEFRSAAKYTRYVEKLYEAKIKTETAGVMRTDLEVLYVWGPPGSGKTRQVFEEYDIADMYRVTSYEWPWDDYRGEKVLVLDEFSSSLKFAELLNVLDIYPQALRSRYYHKFAAWEKVIIITNLPYHNQYPAIQEEHPEHYAALHRRVPVIRKFEKDGSFVDMENLAR